MEATNKEPGPPRRGSSSEDTSTLNDTSSHQAAREYAYFMPIGESITKDDGDGKDDEIEGMPRPRRINSTRYMEDEDRAELQRIATALSTTRPSATRAEQSFRTLSAIASIPADDPALDPSSGSFDLTKWLKRFMKMFIKEGYQNPSLGLVFKDLNVSGSGSALQLQDTMASQFSPLRIFELFSFGKKEHKQILRNFNGVLQSGEMLIVLGRPGSGCSTLLKSMTGQLHGLALDQNSTIHYNGIPQKKMVKEFKGEVIYNQEVDRHFPHLTVGQTLEFAAACRTPQQRPMGMSRGEMARHMAQVIMAVLGLSHTYNTKVGDDFVRGVSGGERKRVSIAEMVLGHSMFGAWDNSTRGLDSAGALNFVRSLRIAADISGTTSAVAIYQASQAIYDLFEKAVVLYEGRQIYYGPADKAKAFFERQGWYCPPRQTTGDFLTSVTNPSERQPREGMENKVPRTPDDFEKYWQESNEFKELQREIQAFEDENPYDPHGDNAAKALSEEKQLGQAKHVRPKSPYLISIPMQIKLNTVRAYQRIWGDISATATNAAVNVIMAVIVGSIFFGTPDATIGFYSKGSVLFLAVLVNALTAISEINSLYNQRPIVEKHNSYSFYHPWTEAAAGVVSDIPVKFVIAVAFNLVLYFMSGLRREPAQFFLYFLIVYMITFVMSGVFRTLAAVTKTISQAMALSGIMVLALVIYTGFAITVPDMKPWFSWIRWINPLFYAFEILVSNEFHGRDFVCSARVPAYSPSIGDSWICNTVGAVAGQATVSGDAFIQQNYQYSYSHTWRNFGIMIAFLIFFMAIYFVAVELNSNTSSTAEQLVFPRGKVPAYMKQNSNSAPDEESPKAAANEDVNESSEGEIKAIPPQKDIFTWKDVVYDIEIKGEPRRLLDHVNGFVKPGTLTALMGVSGAGKTTLLDVLAQRTTMGVITGDMFVNGKPQDASFQRKTGYVQQQDLHLETASVRESLRFSAMLRQPKTVSKQEKYDYVEEVIDMLNMRDFADAIVGVPGEGLNVEQRKLLTIGVELAAKPKLLLFLDEPTSGLDSQSSWAICAFLRKLADAGQAILCTIHQPSAILFQTFDRLLFLAKGGKTVYFGPIGENSRTLLDYFEANGGRECGEQENPAEYMLEIVNQGKNDQGEEWHEVWKNSKNSGTVLEEIEQFHKEKKDEPTAGDDDPNAHDEFAMPFGAQLTAVTVRVFQQYWRMPSYISAKFFLAVAAGLFIGFTFFQQGESQAGVQNVLFSVFMLTTIFSSLVQQIQPLFITQRSLYEVRERPSKAYSWGAFVIANIVVEIPYQVFTGVLAFGSYYYAVNGVQSSLRQGLVLLFIIQLFIYASTFAHMTIAAMPDAQTAAAIVTFLMIMMTLFSGVLQGPNALPGFWIFMYRVSPFTYWIGGIVGTELHDRAIQCADREFSIFSPPAGQTCGDYLAPYLAAAPGTLDNPNATVDCRYCPVSTADQILAGSNIYWDQKWRNYGIVWAFIAFNAFVAVLTYYLFRVKKWNNVSLPKFGSGKKSQEKKESQKEEKSSHFNIFRR